VAFPLVNELLAFNAGTPPSPRVEVVILSRNDPVSGMRVFRSAQRYGLPIQLYRSIRAAHGWGERFETEPRSDVLDVMSEMAPREMRRAWMTGFGNAKLDRRDHVQTRDLPDARGKRSAIGFVQ
jgi:hypothetical protein